MRLAALALISASLVLSTPSRAQPVPEAGSPYVLDDSTRILPRWLEGQIQGGIGWMGSPGFERSRYQAGVGGAAAAEARPARRLVVRARIAYQDLPPDPFELVLGGSTPVDIALAVGHGSLATGLVELGTPVSRSIWAFAGAGGAHYGSNSASGVLVTGDMSFRRLEESGWGSAWSAGLQYRFEPNPRDHFYVEGRSESVAAGTRFRFWALALGYRFP